MSDAAGGMLFQRHAIEVKD